ncbi:hypothetical protein CAOG_00585 [Capsaspora owczarzaki ATCC 30864]|uniref:SH3 domain-binding protein 5 n=1 Tax=Capsaspora owczarzaki (strain ATCC 30864) TaxID=595528 RepID=A0A0D2U1E4_CAPO3|nr:hypothetical protein CAOG_00585 [Capsaspora owczarzaki ATCC 30864]KJE89026.1 hypothetical protein CAOG_000585 [Capsaspora owczarzaki ATCC 30864]|eukprot:XP_004365456.1 hypothetical protein CAOG_00585 [Capsaspora owczarzaki ATCC 30864]
MEALAGVAAALLQRSPPPPPPPPSQTNTQQHQTNTLPSPHPRRTAGNEQQEAQSSSVDAGAPHIQTHQASHPSSTLLLPPPTACANTGGSGSGVGGAAGATTPPSDAVPPACSTSDSSEWAPTSSTPAATTRTCFASPLQPACSADTSPSLPIGSEAAAMARVRSQSAASAGSYSDSLDSYNEDDDQCDDQSLNLQSLVLDATFNAALLDQDEVDEVRNSTTFAVATRRTGSNLTTRQLSVVLLQVQPDGTTDPSSILHDDRNGDATSAITPAVPGSAEVDDDEIADPRIKGALEALNFATEEINRLERELEASKRTLRVLDRDGAKQLLALAQKLGKAVDRSRAYYNLKHEASEAHRLAIEAAKTFEKACSAHDAAKERLAKAERHVLTDNKKIDPVWHDMMATAATQVIESENAKRDASTTHQALLSAAAHVSTKLEAAARDIKPRIAKAKPYYDLQNELREQRTKLVDKQTFLAEEIALAKRHVQYSLSNLNDISMEIHEQRRARKAEASGSVNSHPGDVSTAELESTTVEELTATAVVTTSASVLSMTVAT